MKKLISFVGQVLGLFVFIGSLISFCVVV